jgi:hypothetical protein
VETLNEERLGLSSRQSTLIERVDASLHTGDVPHEWGHPLLSTTPKSVAIQALALQIEGVENAVREIARDVQMLILDVQKNF